MKTHLFDSIFWAAVLLLSTTPVMAQQAQEIFLADPTIYVENGKYYLTGTSGSDRGPKGFQLLESTDLKEWSTPSKSNESPHMLLVQGKQTFGSIGFWAPQLLKKDDKYYLTYTANEQTVLSESTSILGPYTQPDVTPIDGTEKNIDSYIFKDSDGTYYLYHVRFSEGNYLWVAEFDMESGKIRPETLKKCFDQTEPWEATPLYESAPIMEGPTVIKLEDTYYMFYSANHFMNIDYAVGYAVADSPYGPWKKYEGNPIIHRSIVGEHGSGHGDLFEGLDGQLYYVYHTHYDKEQVIPRRTRIVPVNRVWDAAAGLYQFSVDGDKVIKPVLSRQ